MRSLTAFLFTPSLPSMYISTAESEWGGGMKGDGDVVAAAVTDVTSAMFGMEIEIEALHTAASIEDCNLVGIFPHVIPNSAIPQSSAQRSFG